jgi:RNA polymerase sigma factor (sigma-70 family)
MLTHREEVELIRRAQRGDRGARDRLWVIFHELAVAEARRLAVGKGADLDEAESQAAVAIPQAIDSFDLRRRVRFSTYLANRLLGSTTAVARRQRRQSVFNTARLQREPTVPEHRDPKPPPSSFWSPKALSWAKGVRRRNDRLIIKWLWLDPRPKAQAEIARKLEISRSAVCQRRRVLINRLRLIDPRTVFNQ